MPDRPSDGGREPTSSTARSTTTDADRAVETGSGVDDGVGDSGATDVDDEVQRRLREAYLNDAERELIVTGVRSTDDGVVVEFRTPHGDATHVERFPAPRHGSLSESAAFLAFLESAGVSPLDVDELVGTRVPATYEDGGWRLDESYLPDSTDEASDGDAEGETARQKSAWERSREWLWTYRYWLFAAVLIGGELLFAALVIVLLS